MLISAVRVAVGVLYQIKIPDGAVNRAPARQEDNDDDNNNDDDVADEENFSIFICDRDCSRLFQKAFYFKLGQKSILVNCYKQFKEIWSELFLLLGKIVYQLYV